MNKAAAPVVAVLGAGKIGEVLLSGLLRSGWPAGRLLATTRRDERAAELSERYGIEVVATADAVARADVLAIAVKPQDAAALMADLGPVVVPAKADREPVRRVADVVLRQVAARFHAGGPGHDQHPGPGR